MGRNWTWALGLCALAGCTSVRMQQRDGCWVKQTEKWPGRVSEELGFCSKAPPVWSQDPLARLVQECMVQSDYRWQNRALSAWNHDEPIPPPESDEKIAATCMKEAAAALGPESERSALKSRVADLSKDREALRSVTENDREFLKQSSDKMASALGEAAKKPAPAAVATATSTGTATTESDVRSAHEAGQAVPPTTVVGFGGPPAPATVVIAPPAAAAPVAVMPGKPGAPANACAAQRKPLSRKVGDKPAQDEPDCAKNATPSPAAAPPSPRAG
jgi:hypothetical protein